MKKINVIPLQNYQKEFNKTHVDESEIFVGFSKRLNYMLDLADINCPLIDRGRQAYIAKVFESSKMASADWLKKDRVPKPLTLRRMVQFLINHISGEYNDLRVEAWLKYGEPAIPSPFKSLDQMNRVSMPLAMSIIALVSSHHEIRASTFDLNIVLEQTLLLLASENITTMDGINDKHKESVKCYILQSVD